MTQEARSAAPSRKKTPSPAGKSEGRARTGTEPVFQHYQSAVQLLQQGKYEKALGILEKLLPEAPAEIQDRCRMYITTCRRQMAKASLSFLTPEEHYDYAISLLNTGYYEEAREQFSQILTAHPRPTMRFTGWRLLESITGRAQDCLANLARAIELNPEEPASGTRRQRLPKHGGRSALHRIALS